MNKIRTLLLIFAAFCLLIACRFFRDVSGDLTVVSTADELYTTDTPTETPIENPNSSAQVFSSLTYQVSKTNGVEYAQGLSHSDWNSADAETISLLLDIYEPIGAPDKRPALILIHGGGFKGGSRMHSPLTQMAEYFASRGWVCVSIDYRLLEDYGTIPQDWMDATGKLLAADTAAYDQTLALYPASRDAKAAVRWLYANAEEYQIDTDHIAVAGGSAGAYLSVMLGASEAGISVLN